MLQFFPGRVQSAFYGPDGYAQNIGDLLVFIAFGEKQEWDAVFVLELVDDLLVFFQQDLLFALVAYRIGIAEGKQKVIYRFLDDRVLFGAAQEGKVHPGDYGGHPGPEITSRLEPVAEAESPGNGFLEEILRVGQVPTAFEGVGDPEVAVLFQGFFKVIS